jgi:Tripartite tricarboxylate transporter family receptor
MVKRGMATAGVGSPPHVYGELFNAMAGVDLIPVHYRGGGPALVDLLGRDGHHVSELSARRDSGEGANESFVTRSTMRREAASSHFCGKGPWLRCPKCS